MLPSTSVCDAREDARFLLGKIASGKNPVEEKKAKALGKLTLFSFIDGDFGDYIRAHNKASEVTISILKSSFLVFANKPLTEIDRQSVVKWRIARIKSGIKSATINRNITDLGSHFTHAVKWKLLQENPLKSIKKLTETGNPIVRYLSDDEEKRLRSMLDKRECRNREGRANANAWREARKYDLLPAMPTNQFIDHLKPAIVGDILIAVVDGLKGFPESISAAFPQMQIQTCIVHMIRNSLGYVGWKDRKAVAAELKTIYRATIEAEAGLRWKPFPSARGA